MANKDPKTFINKAAASIVLYFLGSVYAIPRMFGEHWAEMYGGWYLFFLSVIIVSTAAARSTVGSYFVAGACIFAALLFGLTYGQPYPLRATFPFVPWFAAHLTLALMVPALLLFLGWAGWGPRLEK